jgi:L-ascorbate metabolism protein UlaG (beta-lactamase superfamily)
MAATELAVVHKKEDTESLLRKNLEEKEAIIWYLGHSGWAIRTKHRFLIFDYSELGKERENPSLANGYILPSELEQQNIVVFVTHEHKDHFCPSIFSWRRSLKNITYILGWSYERGANCFFLEPRQKIKISGVEISTIASTDSGVGFYVKVDGLIIFHGGDHALWGPSMITAFSKEIDYLAEKDEQIDIIFLAVSPTSETLRKWVLYAIKRLQSKIMFPMHAGNNEVIYKDFAKQAEEEKLQTRIYFPSKKGDRFTYKCREIIQKE